jgi:hypothetical protein
MRSLKLVHSGDSNPVQEQTGNRVEIDPQDTITGLLADLSRGLDPDLGRRAAICISELVQQRDQAMTLMRDCSVLLKTALTNLNAFKARL